MTAFQTKFPTAPSIFKFAQHGESGAWLSELLPHTAKVVDDLAIVRSMHTEQINHDPAVTFFQTGFQLAGRPSIGSWISYGLGSENKDLPAFIVMVSQGDASGTQALADRMWNSGFLSTKYQGVKFRSGHDPVLFLSNPEGYETSARRRFLDDLGKMNELNQHKYQDPEIATRIAQYEMAFRMQTSVPELDRSLERARVHLRYVRPRCAQARHLRGQLHLLARRLPSAASASSSSSIAAGTSTAICRRKSPASAATPISPPPRSFKI